MELIKIFTILLTLTFNLGFSQDGRSLILIHNYANKAVIDPIANPTQGNIAFNQEDNSIYVFNGTKWIVDAYYKNIITTSAVIPLEENNYTFIIEADILTTLPAAVDHIGRECVLKNTLATEVSVSNYNNNFNDISTVIPAYNTLKVQSNGTVWHQVNNYLTTTTTPTLPISTLFGSIYYDDTGGDGSTGNNDTEIEFTYGTGASPDITIVQILVSDVAYSGITIDESKVRTPTFKSLDAYTNVVSELSPSGTAYNHLITINLSGSALVIEDGELIDIDFSRIGSDGANNASSVTFYTN